VLWFFIVYITESGNEWECNYLQMNQGFHFGNFCSAVMVYILYSAFLNGSSQAYITGKEGQSYTYISERVTLK
jgi:hypothetical protein